MDLELTPTILEGINKLAFFIRDYEKSKKETAPQQDPNCEEKKENPTFCKCGVCCLRLFGQCPTKTKLLIENLEKEIEDKKKNLNILKSSIWLEYAPDELKYKNN